MLDTNQVRDLAALYGVSQMNVRELETILSTKIAEQNSQSTRIEAVRARAGDIPLTTNLYNQAYSSGMSFSAFLEKQDPSARNDELDAFERQLYVAGIRTKSDPRLGIYCDKVDKFWHSDKPGAEVLFPEFIARTWRQASNPTTRFYQSDSPASDILNPVYLDQTISAKKIAPAIPLAPLLASTQGIDAGTYQKFYLTDDSTQRTMVRVGQGADLPTATLTGGDHSIVLKKYGRLLRGSYEVFRRSPIDRFQLHIAMLAVQAEVDKVSTLIDIGLSGDGNTGSTPTNSNLTTMDSGATAGTLTLKGYMRWKMQWTSPYQCDVMLATEAIALQVFLLTTGTANIPLYMLPSNLGPGVSALNASGMNGVRVGWDSGVTANYILGFDSRFTFEMVNEIGTTLTETDRIIRSQFNEIAMSEVVGFCVLDANGLRTMDVGT